MRTTIIGLLLGFLAAFVLLLTFQQDRVEAANRQQPEQNLTVFTSPSGQQITMVDLQRRVMSVYHVDTKSGQIILKSVRNVRWDFELEDFNGSIPTPGEIRSMAKNR